MGASSPKNSVSPASNTNNPPSSAPESSSQLPSDSSLNPRNPNTPSSQYITSQTNTNPVQPSSSSHLPSNNSLLPPPRNPRNSSLPSPIQQQQSLLSQQSSPSFPPSKHSITHPSVPLSSDQLSLQTLPPSGSIDITSYIQDVRFCRKSKQLKTFKSIKHKTLSKLSWVINESKTQYQITLQDVKILSPHETAIVKPMVIFYATVDGEFVSMERKGKMLRWDKRVAEEKVKVKDQEEIEMELKLIWNMVRKGQKLPNQQQTIEGTIRTISYRQEQNQQDLIKRDKKSD